MHIGLDFDNTLVCYNGLFLRLGRERGVLPEGCPADKTAIRDHLRAAGREDVWTEMQGEAYGVRIGEAVLFEGVRGLVARALDCGWRVSVVSHKTRYPFAGPECDLHHAARGFLNASGLAGKGMLGEGDVFFELTKEAKAERIAALGCELFVDDLPEFLGADFFPAGVRRILFDPAGVCPEGPWECVPGWGELREKLKI